ncbi:MAG TPA: hypothetical protein VIO81_13230 [Methyloversatilis sp.]
MQCIDSTRAKRSTLARATAHGRCIGIVGVPVAGALRREDRDDASGDGVIRADTRQQRIGRRYRPRASSRTAGLRHEARAQIDNPRDKEPAAHGRGDIAFGLPTNVPVMPGGVRQACPRLPKPFQRIDMPTALAFTVRRISGELQ